MSCNRSSSSFPVSPTGRLMKFLEGYFLRFFCIMRGVTPADDDFSGYVLPSGEVVRVYRGQDGNLYYLDKDGSMQLIKKDDIPDGEFLNIREAFHHIDKICVQFPGQIGTTLRLQRVRTFNSDSEVLKEHYEVMESNGGGYPVGMELASIPAGYVKVDCTYFDDKFILSEKVCFDTPRGSLSVARRTVISRNPADIAKYSSIVVLDSSDSNYPYGASFVTDVPSDWTSVPCECRCVQDVNIVNSNIGVTVNNDPLDVNVVSNP